MRVRVSFIAYLSYQRTRLSLAVDHPLEADMSTSSEHHYDDPSKEDVIPLIDGEPGIPCPYYRIYQCRIIVGPLGENQQFPPGGNSSAKIWSLCLARADKYDKSLVESWKGDMDGILIFVSFVS